MYVLHEKFNNFFFIIMVKLQENRKFKGNIIKIETLRIDS